MDMMEIASICGTCVDRNAQNSLRSKKIRCPVLVLVLLLLTSAPSAFALTNTWTGASDTAWNNDANWSGNVPVAGEDVVIPSGSTVVASADNVAQGLASLTINGGIVTFQANFADNGNGTFGVDAGQQTLVVTGNLNINGGTLIVTGRQDTATTGVGVTFTAANFTVAAGAVVHSDQRGFAPGDGPANGGHGGRAANNHDLPYGSPTAPVTLGSGGGNGGARDLTGAGAIRIEVGVGTVTLNGSIRCNGQSNTGITFTRGGAGGSIYINCGTFAGSGLMQANGGNATSAGGGGGRLAVDWSIGSTFSGDYDCGGGTGGSSVQAGTLSLPAGVDWTVRSGFSVGLTAGVHTLGDVVIESGAELFLHSESSSATGNRINATSFQVDNGGLVQGDADGFAPGAGPGAGASTTGGSHGGRGANNPDPANGSATAPVNLGSGGNSGGGSRSQWGGSAIRISTGVGAVTVNGVIRTNGQGGSDTFVGGGAGGSIFIECGTISGNGLIEARGGNCSSGGGGSGGRISIVPAVMSFVGDYNVGGGVASSGDSQPGTLSIPEGATVDLTIRNGNGIGFEPGTHTFGNIVIESNAKLFFHRNPSTGVTNTLNVVSLDLKTNGEISAQFDGFPPGQGPGFGGTSSGGAHGGRGGNNGDVAYSVATAPVTSGSSGSNGGGGRSLWGGGVIRINAGAGSVNFDGLVRCDGQGSAETFTGGGAGGSIYVTCGAFSGAGTLRSLGGRGVAGGGGGSIALAYVTSTFTGSTDVSGGIGSSGNNGEAGTVTPANLDLADHTALVAVDQFIGAGNYLDAELLKFNLSTAVNTDHAPFEPVDITRLVFDLTSVGGILPSDLSNIEVFIDSNDDGSSLDEGAPLATSLITVVETTAVTATITVDFSSGTLQLNADPNRNLILQVDVANVATGDKMTVQLNAVDARMTGAGTVLTRTANVFNATNTVGFAQLSGATTSVQHVIPGNAPPRALDDSYTILEDAVLTVVATGVLTNDGDADGNAITAVLGIGPTNGILTLNPNGSFVYDPNPNFVGIDTFTYAANDTLINGNFATVTITVTTLNDAPVAVADSYKLENDVPLTVAAPGVLGNDTDVENDPLTAILISGPTNGTLTLNADGSFTYSANAGFSGFDSFTYAANDMIFNSVAVTVTLEIFPALNANPAAAPTVLVAGETSILSSNPTGGSGTYVSFQWTGPNGFTSTLQNPGAVTLPDPGFFTYILTVTDSEGFSDTTSVSIAALGSALLPNPTADPVLIGLGGSTTLSANPTGGSGVYVAYQWTGPNGFSSTLQNPGSVTPIQPGQQTYSLTVFDASGLTATASVDVIVAEMIEGVFVPNSKASYKVSSASTPSRPMDRVKVIMRGVDLSPGDKVAVDINGTSVGDWKAGDGLILDEKLRASGQLGTDPWIWYRCKVSYRPKSRKVIFRASRGLSPTNGKPMVMSKTGVSPAVVVAIMVDRAPSDGRIDAAYMFLTNFKVRYRTSGAGVTVESGRKTKRR